MIIDLILDRKDGDYYDATSFYNNVIGYEKSSNIGNSISKAFKSGKERNVKQALIDYIDENGYNNSVKKYIQSVDWLVSDNELEERTVKSLESLQKRLFSAMDAFIDAVEDIDDNIDDYLSFYNDLSFAKKLETEKYINSYIINYGKELLKLIKQ